MALPTWRWGKGWGWMGEASSLTRLAKRSRFYEVSRFSS